MPSKFREADRIEVFLFFFFFAKSIKSLFIILLLLLLLFLLYNILLVLPYINMHTPWVYTCSPSWALFLHPSPYHPSGSSQVFLEHWEANIDWGGQYGQEMKMRGFWSDQSRQRKVIGYERNWTSLVALELKNPPPNAGEVRDVVWFLGREDPLEEGMSTHFKYFYLENTMDRGPWWAMVHRVTKSWTRLKWLSTHKKEIELGKTHRIWWDKDLLSGKQRREVSKTISQFWVKPLR